MKLFETVSSPTFDSYAGQNDRVVTHASFFKGGYGNYGSRSSFIAITVFNMVVAFLLILLALPVFVILGVVIKIIDGGPIFYRGVRLGWRKRPFFMYKFRTLPVGAQKTIGAVLHNEKIMPLSPLCKYLRDTRLDELPQLFNVLRGEMDFVGPRPIRPEIYEAMCTSIPNYDLRFSVRPGLVGVAQIFTPHSSPKRIRAFIDNHFLYIRRNLLWDITLISYTGFMVLRAVLIKGILLFYRIVINEKLLGIYREKRSLERIHVNNVVLVLTVKNDPAKNEVVCRFMDINDSYIKLIAPVMLDKEKDYILDLIVDFTIPGGKRKTKRAVCNGKVFKTFLSKSPEESHTFVVGYVPISPFNQYIMDKYFLRKSIA
jgi:lipopolysaccharide/colanic/teichoic acid biosynthesis glycosyltransferase